MLTPSISRAQHYQVENMTGHRGTPRVMLEDSRHYLWLGNAEGLLRYNGIRFQPIGTDSLGAVLAMAQDTAHRIWIGTTEALLLLEGKACQTFPFNQNITSLLTDEEGTLWIGTTSGLYRHHEGHFQLVEKLAGSPQVNQLFIDSKGRLWIACKGGLYQKSLDGLHFFSMTQGFQPLDVSAISESKDGRIWMSSPQQGVYVWSDGEFERFHWSDLLEERGTIQCMLHDATGKLWIGTENSGLFIYDPYEDTYQWLRNTEGIESNNVTSLLMDSWGSVWVGSLGGGVSKCRSTRPAFLFFDKNDFFDGHAPTALAFDERDYCWVGTSNGIYRQAAASFEPTAPELGFPKEPITDLLANKHGLWVATDHNGILLYDTSRFIRLGSAQGIAGEQIKSMATDSAGTLWVAGYRGGISKVVPERIDSVSTTYPVRHFGTEAGISNYINYILLDRQQILWFATADGRIGKMTNDSLAALYSIADGLPSVAISCLATDERGFLWAASRHNGLLRLNILDDSLKLRKFGQTEGLTTHDFQAVHVDGQGNLWATHASGIDYILLSRTGEIKEVVFYGHRDGFSGSLAGPNALAEDRNGQLWIGTTRGLYKHLPSRQEVDSLLPRPLFTNILIQGQAIENTDFADLLDGWGRVVGSLILSSQQSDLLLEYEAPRLNQGEQMRYQWKLEGRFEEWLPPSQQQQLALTDLPPGDYTFAVRAVTVDGTFAGPALELPIQVVPPFWQTAWFKILTSLFLLFVIWQLFAWRVRRIKARARVEQERLQMEKQMLELEQKALSLQMNPHFIFNALNSVQAQISQQNAKTARYQLAKFSRLMRRILENSRSQHISLEEEIALLEDYLSLERFSHNESFDYRIELEDELPVASLQIPPMMIQPFVENAIVHGFSGKAVKGRIVIKFSRQAGKLLCCIQDNGIGRVAAAKRKSQQQQRHKSAALQVTRERLDLLMGTGEKPSLEMVDLSDEEGRASGTQVWLRLPMEELI